jgi:tetratricopeptide (TPR) repeat protein
VPLDWAAAENNLGVVLRKLGQRDGTIARLEEAVAAHRAALEEFTRDRVPLQWAMTQNNLGIALKTLGEWEGKTLGEWESGTARLEEAVAAYRAALEEYTPDAAPLQRAQTQMNFGNALLTLGQREDGTARLDEAVAVYRKALDLDPAPIDQANIQFNMGIALSDLGHRKPSTESLKEALVSFREACAVFRAAGMMQLSIPCLSAISPLEKDLEPGTPSNSEPSKPAG